jgi:hypothetical protein
MATWLGTFTVWDRYGAGTDPAVHHQIADLKTGPTALSGAPAAEPVPEVGNGLFDEVAHGNLRLCLLLKLSGLILKPLATWR